MEDACPKEISRHCKGRPEQDITQEHVLDELFADRWHREDEVWREFLKGMQLHLKELNF